MIENNSNDTDFLYYFDTPTNYLKSEYLRSNYRNKDIQDIDLNSYFKKVKHLYGTEEVKLFESDKILFEELKRIACSLKVPISEQDRSTFWLLNRHVENILKILKENNIPIPKDITIGTLPLPDLNAFISEFSENRKLIVMNHCLFEMLYLISRIVSSCFLIKKQDNKNNMLTIDFNKSVIDETLKSNNKYNIRFLEVLISYFSYNKLPLSKIYFEEDDKMNFSAALYDNAEFFIVAHEFAHILNNTVYSKNDIEKHFPDISPELYELVTNWLEELNADNLALQLTLSNNNKESSGLLSKYIGVEFLFGCLNIIEEIDININNLEISETHPSFEVRIDKLRIYMKNFFPKEVDNLFNCADTILYVLNKLWNENKDIFYANLVHI